VSPASLVHKQMNRDASVDLCAHGNVLDGSTYWCHLANMIKRFMHSNDAHCCCHC